MICICTPLALIFPLKYLFFKQKSKYKLAFHVNCIKQSFTWLQLKGNL